jgi:hypothetical protein
MEPPYGGEHAEPEEPLAQEKHESSEDESFRPPTIWESHAELQISRGRLRLAVVGRVIDLG